MSGLEVVGSIASVAQLAGTVYSISKTLYEVGNALSNAPSDIKDLAGDLERFSEELHLYARLLDKKHYDDQFHRLTAKIIGECATICTKIDRVLRKLRSGSVWARVKWLYKEKEIVKLLTRLRDLKFSLLSILQLMKYLKADHEIDAIGGPNRSLIEGSREDGLSDETAAQVEATRKKLAGISVAIDLGPVESSSEQVLADHSNERVPQVPRLETVESSQSTETLSGETLNENPQPESRSLTSSLDMTDSFNIVSPPVSTNSIMRNQNTSIQSFHSAVSHFDPDAEDQHLQPWNTSAVPQPGFDTEALRKCIHKTIDTENTNLHLGLKADFVASAMKHFQMCKEDAETWAAASVAQVGLPPIATIMGRNFESASFSGNEINIPCSATAMSRSPPAVSSTSMSKHSSQPGRATSTQLLVSTSPNENPVTSSAYKNVCDFCGKTFNQQDLLEKHVKMHADDSVVLQSPVTHQAKTYSTHSTAEMSQKIRLPACTSCRNKKLSCDGIIPTCSTCVRRGYQCGYNTTRMKSRPMSRNYVTALEQRLEQVETLLKTQPVSPDLRGEIAAVTQQHQHAPQGYNDTPVLKSPGPHDHMIDTPLRSPAIHAQMESQNPRSVIKQYQSDEDAEAGMYSNVSLPGNNHVESQTEDKLQANKLQSPAVLQKNLDDFVHKLRSYQSSWKGSEEQQYPGVQGLGDQYSMSQQHHMYRPVSHLPPNEPTDLQAAMSFAGLHSRDSNVSYVAQRQGSASPNKRTRLPPYATSNPAIIRGRMRGSERFPDVEANVDNDVPDPGINFGSNVELQIASPAQNSSLLPSNILKPFTPSSSFGQISTYNTASQSDNSIPPQLSPAMTSLYAPLRTPSQTVNTGSPQSNLPANFMSGIENEREETPDLFRHSTGGRSEPLKRIVPHSSSDPTYTGYNFPAMAGPITSNVHSPGHQMALAGNINTQYSQSQHHDQLLPPMYPVPAQGIVSEYSQQPAEALQNSHALPGEPDTPQIPYSPSDPSISGGFPSEGQQAMPCQQSRRSGAELPTLSPGIFNTPSNGSPFILPAFPGQSKAKKSKRGRAKRPTKADVEGWKREASLKVDIPPLLEIETAKEEVKKGVSHELSSASHATTAHVGFPPGSGTAGGVPYPPGNLSSRLRDIEPQIKHTQFPSNAFPVHELRLSPIGLSSRRSSRMGNAQYQRLSPNSNEFRPSPYAAAFNPNSRSSPRFPANKAEPPTPTTKKLLNRKPLAASQRPSLREKFNPNLSSRYTDQARPASAMKEAQTNRYTGHEKGGEELTTLPNDESEKEEEYSDSLNEDNDCLEEESTPNLTGYNQSQDFSDMSRNLNGMGPMENLVSNWGYSKPSSPDLFSGGPSTLFTYPFSRQSPARMPRQSDSSHSNDNQELGLADPKYHAAGPDSGNVKRVRTYGIDLITIRRDTADTLLPKMKADDDTSLDKVEVSRNDIHDALQPNTAGLFLPTIETPPAPPSFILWYPELPKVLWPGVLERLAYENQGPFSLYKELWWRAFIDLSVRDRDSCKYVHGAWLSACRSHNTGFIVKTRVISNGDGDIARTTAAVLENCLQKVGHGSEASSLHRIADILKVIRNSVDFKNGCFIWTIFCQVTIWLIHRHGGRFPDQTSTFTALADLATLIARYNVMESMYHEWPGMTLENKYEDSLINLCIIVLQYLNKVMQQQPWLSSDPTEDLTSYASKIAVADTACRGFTVTIVPEVVQRDRGTKRTIEVVEDEDSDSDSTLREHAAEESSVGLLPNPKRVKVRK